MKKVKFCTLLILLLVVVTSLMIWQLGSEPICRLLRISKLDYGSAVILIQKRAKRLQLFKATRKRLRSPQSDIDDIVQARLEELFRLVIKESYNEFIKPVSYQGVVVLTGGGALMKHIDTFAKDALKLPARVGAPKHVSGVIEQN
jgi:cell division ATPase FtsA